MNNKPDEVMQNEKILDEQPDGTMYVSHIDVLIKEGGYWYNTSTDRVYWSPLAPGNIAWAMYHIVRDTAHPGEGWSLS